MSIGEIMRDPVLAPLAVVLFACAFWCLREATQMRRCIEPKYFGSARERSDIEHERDPPDAVLAANGQRHKRRSWIAGSLFFAALGLLIVVANGR